MKNLLFLGVIALLLFSLSAALSLWLNQSRKEEAAQTDGKDAKALAPKSETPKDTPEQKTIPKLPAPGAGTPDAGLLDQQAKLERKALQISMVLQDVQSQREATDLLLKQVTTELKNATKDSQPTVPNPATEARLKKEREEQLAAEKASFKKLADVYDAMTPEGAAPILKQMAESGPGKLEQAAQILALMKDRNSARLLETLGDAPLAAQLFQKMLQLKGLNAAPAPGLAPAPLPGGLTPVRGP